MTFDQVLVFHKIVQTGSFKAAAAELHRTQPAISLAIKRLEEEMEVELFDRTNYRPILTDHGKAFLERSHKTLQGMYELEGLAKSFRNQEEPELKLALDGISPLPKLLRHLRQFSDRFSNTKLSLGLDILSEAERRVLDRDAQMGITHFLTEKDALETLPLTSIRMIPVISQDLFAEKKLKTQDQLFEIDQIVVGDKSGHKGTSFGLLEGGKKWRVMDSNFKREIILAGLGWGHLPEHQIERELKEKKLVELRFGQIHSKDLMIHLIRLKKHQFGPVGRTLWDELASLHQV